MAPDGDTFVQAYSDKKSASLYLTHRMMLDSLSVFQLNTQASGLAHAAHAQKVFQQQQQQQ
jgi:hypothetical protein